MIATRSRWSVSNKALRASLLLAMLLAFNRRQRKLLDEAVLVDDEVGDSSVGGDKLIGGSAWLLCASGAKGDEYTLWSAKGRLARTHTGQNQSDSQSALSFSYSSYSLGSSRHGTISCKHHSTNHAGSS